MTKLTLLAPSSSVSEALKPVVFMVEASDFERSVLWGRYAKESPDHRQGCNVQWTQVLQGYTAVVTQIGEKPVWVSLSFAKLDGSLVLFYHSSSRFVDYTAIEKWLEQYCPAAKDVSTGRINRIDAQNFHICMHAVMKKDTTADS